KSREIQHGNDNKSFCNDRFPKNPTLAIFKNPIPFILPSANSCTDRFTDGYKAGSGKARGKCTDINSTQLGTKWIEQTYVLGITDIVILIGRPLVFVPRVCVFRARSDVRHMQLPGQDRQ